MAKQLIDTPDFDHYIEQKIAQIQRLKTNSREVKILFLEILRNLGLNSDHFSQEEKKEIIDMITNFITANAYIMPLMRFFEKLKRATEFSEYARLVNISNIHSPQNLYNTPIKFEGHDYHHSRLEHIEMHINGEKDRTLASHFESAVDAVRYFYTSVLNPQGNKMVLFFKDSGNRIIGIDVSKGLMFILELINARYIITTAFGITVQHTSNATAENVIYKRIIQTISALLSRLLASLVNK